MIDLTLVPYGGLGWLDASGPDSHLVLSTRIRLARNLAGRAFTGRNSESEREAILQDVEQASRDTVLPGTGHLSGLADRAAFVF